MSTEQSSGYDSRYVDVLTMREEILVKSASIIDDVSFESGSWQDLKWARLFWADWTDPITGMTFQLQAQGERVNPETVDFDYRLQGSHTEITDSTIDFRYNSYTSKFQKKNDKGKFKKCSKDEVEMLHGYLASFGTGLSEEEIDTFFDSMQSDDIHDTRLRASIKRTLARLLPDWNQY